MEESNQLVSQEPQKNKGSILEFFSAEFNPGIPKLTERQIDEVLRQESERTKMEFESAKSGRKDGVRVILIIAILVLVGFLGVLFYAKEYIGNFFSFLAGMAAGFGGKAAINNEQ